MKFKIGDKVMYGHKKYIVTEVLEYNSNYTITDVEGYSTWALDKDLKLIKPTINDLRDYMLEHFVFEGNLYIIGLDFSKFDGDVNITDMKVNRSLYSHNHVVKGDLFLSYSKAEGDYHCEGIKYGGNAYVDEPQKTLKEITKEELEEMGYKLKEDK